MYFVAALLPLMFILSCLHLTNDIFGIVQLASNAAKLPLPQGQSNYKYSNSSNNNKNNNRTTTTTTSATVGAARASDNNNSNSNIYGKRWFHQ